MCSSDLPHTRYHECINDRIIYRNEHAESIVCPVCKHSRYKHGKKSPQKVACHRFCPGRVTAVTMEIGHDVGITFAKGAVTVKTVTERPKRRETMAGSRLANRFLPFRPFGHGFHRIGPSRNVFPMFLPVPHRNGHDPAGRGFFLAVFVRRATIFAF